MKLRSIILLVYLWSFNLCKANLPPVFIDDMNNFVLSEQTQIGTVIYQLKGYDPENSEIEYGIIDSENFVVNSTTGEVKLIKSLDREEQETLSILVFIKDRINASSSSLNDNIVKVAISIIVLDENDNKPVFVNVPYNINILEDALPGSTVFSGIVATDSDSVGEILDIDCITEENDAGACSKFSIKVLESSQNRLKAIVFLNDVLNYNEKIFYRMLLSVKDGMHKSSTYLEIRIQDVQNLPPVFQGALTATISEDSPIGASVMVIFAQDGDRGQPRKITYDLLENYMDFFFLDSKTGEIRTARPIDRDVLVYGNSVIKLLVRASETLNGTVVDDQSCSTIAQLQIKIEDMNDSAPTFDASQYYVSIAENTPIGTMLSLNISVADRDVGINAMFSLNLEDVSGVFNMEPKTVMGSSHFTISVSNGTLDYENPNQRKFIILVVAKETYTFAKLSSTSTIEVQIIDLNDNMPSFEKESYYADVSETAKNDHIITQVTAKDIDSGRFGTGGIHYSIIGSGSELFSVDTQNGVIRVAKTCGVIDENEDITSKQYGTPGRFPCLDYETKPEYFLSLVATDDNGNGQSSVVSLRINLIDENDSPPICDSALYEASISEGFIAFEPPLYVTAHDEDLNSMITYRIIGKSKILENFEIDEYSGIISVKNPSVFNTKDLINEMIIIDVEANDGKHSTICKINITINVNYHAPYLFIKSLVTTIQENVAVGTSINQVTVGNIDASKNSKIKFRFQSGNFGDFNINPDSGVITISRKLDYDRRNVYKTIIVGYNSEIPSLYDSLNLTINISNTNDKPPYLTPVLQRAEVFEGAPIGTLVYTLLAFDPDIASLNLLEFDTIKPVIMFDKNGDALTEIDSTNDNFIIEKNGSVVFVKPLKRNNLAIIRMNIIVNDPTATIVQQGKGVLELSIIKVDNLPPEFIAPWTKENSFYFFNIIEEQPIGFTLTHLEAVDKQSREARYEIENNNFFEINNISGLITSKSRIDYENIVNITLTASIHYLEVPQLFSTVILYCAIQNINDNSPVFSSSHYTFSVLENSPVGTIVGTISATDHDKGLFGTIEYSIVGDHSESFYIESSTGIITVNNSTALDREAKTQISFTGIASDLAPLTSRWSSSVQIKIIYLDENDSIPYFDSNVYFAAVAENAAIDPPAAILQVLAKDNDIGDAVRYFIRSGNRDNLFIIDSDSGILYPARNLIGERGQFTMEVEAIDKLGTGHSSFAKMIFEIHSVNQNKPTFIVPDVNNFSIELSHKKTNQNDLVFTIEAEDLDDGDNGKVSYHFKVNNENAQETNEFLISASTGEIRIKKFTQHLEVVRYELILVAKDQGNPTPFESLRFSTIVVLNKQYPTFNETSMHFFIPENGGDGVRVGQVEAKINVLNNSSIFYFILFGNKNDSFYVDRKTGDIYTNKSLDREEHPYYDLYIFATNNPNYTPFNDIIAYSQHNHNTSICRVHVTIIDMNDNGPIIEKENYHVGVSAKASINEVVSKVQAFDKDLGVNGTFDLVISASYLYKYGSSKTTGSIVPSPFTIDNQGFIKTAAYMAEYSQDLFTLEIIAKEIQPPERSNRSYVHIWVFEPEQLIRVILSQPINKVNQEQIKLILELSNATKSMIIVDEIRYHIDSMGRIRMDWSDLYFHAVDPDTNMILPVVNILNIIDAEYDSLKHYYSGLAIENVVPAYFRGTDESFDTALVAIIALFIVIFVGSITFMVLCCCLKNWVIRLPTSSRRKDTLLDKQIVEDLNRTENPLWMEQKLKLYEEQELTMQVFSEPEVLRLCNNVSVRRSSNDTIAVENTYATIQPRINSPTIEINILQ